MGARLQPVAHHGKLQLFASVVGYSNGALEDHDTATIQSLCTCNQHPTLLLRLRMWKQMLKCGLLRREHYWTGRVQRHHMIE